MFGSTNLANNEGLIIIQESVVLKVKEIYIVCDHHHNPTQEEQTHISMPTSAMLFLYTTPLGNTSNKQTNKPNKFSYLYVPFAMNFVLATVLTRE